jgi:hypothetical protein
MNVPKRAVLALALLLCAAPGARADAPESAVATEPEGYRETVEEAVQEFGAHHYEESRSLFARAHALFPNARTHRGLGLTEFELRNYGECIKQFDAALKSTVKSLSDELRADTERMLARANNFVARVLVDAKPGSSTIVVDGVPMEVAPGQALLLQIGNHALEVRAAGYLPERRQLNIQGGEEKTLTIILSQSPQSALSEAPRKDEPRADKPRVWYKSPWLWVGVGVVVAGAAAGTGYALANPKTERAYGGDRNWVLSGP